MMSLQGAWKIIIRRYNVVGTVWRVLEFLIHRTSTAKLHDKTQPKQDKLSKSAIKQFPVQTRRNENQFKLKRQTVHKVVDTFIAKLPLKTK